MCALSKYELQGIGGVAPEAGVTEVVDVGSWPPKAWYKALGPAPLVGSTCRHHSRLLSKIH